MASLASPNIISGFHSRLYFFKTLNMQATSSALSHLQTHKDEMFMHDDYWERKIPPTPTCILHRSESSLRGTNYLADDGWTEKF